jgi:hypothetical protein
MRKTLLFLRSFASEFTRGEYAVLGNLAEGKKFEQKVQSPNAARQGLSIPNCTARSFLS